MLPIETGTLVLWLHILAATVWIGGQVTVAMVMPLLRAHEGLAATVGRRFQPLGWTAFAVLVATGILNITRLHLTWDEVLTTPPGRTLCVKLGLVLVSGLAAAVHALYQARRSRPGSVVPSMVLGTVSVGAAVLAALYGVVLAGG